MEPRRALDMLRDALEDDRTELLVQLKNTQAMSIAEAKEFADLLALPPYKESPPLPEVWKERQIYFLQGKIEHNADMDELVRRAIAKAAVEGEA